MEASSFSSARSARTTRRLPIGAELQAGGGVSFRVWAPRCQKVEVVIEGKKHALQADGEYYEGLVADAGAGTRYRFCLDDGSDLYPDPASRFQPQGPHGPSEVVDASAFNWRDSSWPGVAAVGQVLYEMHIGTFTPRGTFAAATEELAELKALGITCIETMPIAEFAGDFGWGYDGVNLFAPTRLYGRPDDFRRFVDRAHQLGMGVILDVVYNHFGPEGNYLGCFSEHYCTDRHKNDWGRAMNFDGASNAPVREFFITNARYWVEEFHVDGFRFDATQAIVDDSPMHILAEIAAAARAAAGRRKLYLVAENEPQHTVLVRPREKGGYGLDALWNDDFHHSAHVALTGHNEAYYCDHLGRPQEFISAAKWGYLFQGQRYGWQDAERGTPALDLAFPAFINFLENHDQVANSAYGRRAHQLTSPGLHRAITALWLLSPQTPMFFQGQEFSASAPFLYFADVNDELAKLVKEGRGKFMMQFPSLATPPMQALLTDPGDAKTFERCKLDLGERQTHAQSYAMHRDLLRLRREDEALRSPLRGQFDGAALDDAVFVLRYFTPDGDNDRLVIVNLAADLKLNRSPEPLLAPPLGMRWELFWHTEDPRFGGAGAIPLLPGEAWRLQGQSTAVLKPVKLDPPRRAAPVSREASNGSA